MANIEYANPFGSYVKGAEAGTESAIRTGEAARNFRNNDLNYDFLKWYQPLRQREATAATQQQELALNEGVQKNAANLTAFGGPGFNYLSDTINRLYPGYNFGEATAQSPLDLRRAALEGTGQGPSFYDPMVVSQGRYGAVKKESLNPQEYEQAMTLRYGPNWHQIVGPQNTVHGPDSYGAATTGLPWAQPQAVEENTGMNNYTGGSSAGAPLPNYLRGGNAYAPTNIPNDVYSGTGQRQPGQVWHDGGSGGVQTQ